MVVRRARNVAIVVLAIDSTLVMRLPKERLQFIVDTIPVGTVPGRGMIDFHPIESEAFLRTVLGMEWDRLIPGPG